MPNGQRQGGTGCLGGRESVIFSPPCVAVPPLRGTHGPQPLRGDNGERLQGVAQRFTDHLDAVQGPPAARIWAESVRAAPSP